MFKEKLEKILQHLKSEFAKLRAGRASIDLLQSVKVDAYGTLMPLNQVATLSTPEPRVVIVQPWDKSILKNIEKALRENLPDLNPIVDSATIRVPFPAPTEERRKDLVKEVGKICEAAKIKIRRVREDAIAEIETKEKHGEISEDEFHRKKGELQKFVDEYNRLSEEARKKKEEEIMAI